MRWLAGGTLERRLDNGPLDIDAALTLARQIGGALSAAHSRGMIHRDVKSANILFDEDGNAFLSDFGIAQEGSIAGGPEAALSPGSPAYASPEQLRREAVGPASDVFSLGVVLFESLSGSLPFPADTPLDVLVDKQLTEPYPELADVRSDIPEAISLAIAKATAKDPGSRFASVDAFVAALTADGVAPARADTPEAEAASAESLEDLANPYLGLLAFDDTSADRYYGRDRLVGELLARLDGNGTASRCLVIVGPSGSGKSSLARAGLLPKLRRGAVAGSQDWFQTTMTPGDDPYKSLEAALLRIAVNPPATLVDQLRDGRRGILRSVRRCLSSESDRLLLFIDQTEELFLGRSAGDADEFLDALAVATNDPTSPLRLVLTLRADYYQHPLEHPTFAPILDAGAVNVTPLAGDELEQAIVSPAGALGIGFEPGLVARDPTSRDDGSTLAAAPAPIRSCGTLRAPAGRPSDDRVLRRDRRAGRGAGDAGRGHPRRSGPRPASSVAPRLRGPSPTQPRPAPTCGGASELPTSETTAPPPGCSNASARRACSSSTATPPVATRPWRSPTRPYCANGPGLVPGWRPTARCCGRPGCWPMLRPAGKKVDAGARTCCAGSDWVRPST